jgi:hypothetical protein
MGAIEGSFVFDVRGSATEARPATYKTNCSAQPLALAPISLCGNSFSQAEYRRWTRDFWEYDERQLMPVGAIGLGNLADTHAPVVTQALTSDTGSSSTDRITSNDALSGPGDPNAVVQFTVDGSPIAATAAADASGNWNFTPTGLSDGSHTIVGSETDVAGNTGTASLTFTLDTHAPVVSWSPASETGIEGLAIALYASGYRRRRQHHIAGLQGGHGRRRPDRRNQFP